MMDMLSKRNVPESSSHGLEAWSQDGFNLLVSKLARLFLPFTVTPADVHCVDAQISKGKMARWARARNHEKRSFCPSWRIRCVCSLWATSTWICYQMGSLEVGWGECAPIGGVEELKIVIFNKAGSIGYWSMQYYTKKITRHLPTMMNTRLDATHTLKIIKCPKCSAENVQLPFSLFSTP